MMQNRGIFFAGFRAAVRLQVILKSESFGKTLVARLSIANDNSSPSGRFCAKNTAASGRQFELLPQLQTFRQALTGRHPWPDEVGSIQKQKFFQRLKNPRAQPDCFWLPRARIPRWVLFGGVEWHPN
jgi:hypothetical protein